MCLKNYFFEPIKFKAAKVIKKATNKGID